MVYGNCLHEGFFSLKRQFLIDSAIMLFSGKALGNTFSVDTFRKISGIVGGLILGQAAVSAKIVSPIMIIIIAITGIGSFATGNYTLGWSYRLLRLFFIILGSCFGLYGIGTGVFIYSVYLASLNNFGIKFLSPLPGQGMKNLKKSVFTSYIWNEEYRPEFLKTKKIKKEAKISRKWIFDKNK